jgi:hypothetical protein
MSAPDYFAAHALSEHEQLRLQGLELTWDPITRPLSHALRLSTR